MTALLALGVILIVCSWVFAYERGKKDAIDYMDVSSRFMDRLYGKDKKDDDRR